MLFTFDSFPVTVATDPCPNDHVGLVHINHPSIYLSFRVYFFIVIRANKPHSLHCTLISFGESVNKANKRANKPNKLKGLFAIVQRSHVTTTLHRKFFDCFPKNQSNQNLNNVFVTTGF